MAWIYAQLVFLCYVLLHFIKRPFRRLAGGHRQFLAQYAPEGLEPLTSSDKNLLARFSQCINCGYCDSACPALGAMSRAQFPGPSYLVTTLTRATPDFWAAGVDFSLCPQCDRCERACPNQIPVKEALDFIEVKTPKIYSTYR
jgi:succinate dehydrogenase/fumarate reductase-like Fe-S protein